MKPIIKVGTDATASINETISFSGLSSADRWELDEVRLHLSAAATAANSLVITQRSKYGSQYDTVLLTQAMVGVADVFYQPGRPVKLNGKDRVTVTWTNDAGADAKRWGLQTVAKI